MLYYFPRPFPDELIGSVILRACRHFGVSRKKLATMMAEGRGRSYCSMAMSGHLQTIGQAAELEAIDLLWQHTVFPYATAFMSWEETQRLAGTLLATDAESNAALTQCGTQGNLGQRYCPKCLRDDLRTYGEAYWHRIHNLPFVMLCPLHQIPLKATYYQRAHLGLRALPDDSNAPCLMPLLPRKQVQGIIELSENLLVRPIRWPVAQWHHIYRSQAELQNLPRHGTGLASLAIATACHDFYGSVFLQAAGLDFQPSSKSWPAMMLRERQSIPYSSQKHVLLQVFLKHANPSSAMADYQQPGPKVRNYKALDKQFTRRLEQAIDDVRRGSDRVEISSLLSQIGVWHIFRHHRDELPNTVALLTEFKKSNFSARQTGKRRRKQD